MYMYMYIYTYTCTCTSGGIRIPPEAAHIFLWNSDCFGCIVLLCFVVCMTLLASFFLTSVSLIKNFFSLHHAYLNAMRASLCGLSSPASCAPVCQDSLSC